MNQTMRQTLLLSCTLFLSCLLSSCGFHLRGPANLAPPLHRLYLQTSNPYGPLTKGLKQSLKLSGVQFTESAKDASTVLEILGESTSQSLTSVGGTQSTRIYNLVLTVSFQVSDAKGRILVPAQSVAESRPITIQSSQVLGSSNEVNSYYQQMRTTVIYDIMNRLSSKNVSDALAQVSS